MRGSKKSKKGFTLVEVMVSVAIVLVFAGILLVNMNLNRKILLENTAYDIVSVLRYAHNASEHQNRTVVFRIVKQNDVYRYQIIEYGINRTLDKELPKNIKILARTGIEERETNSKLHYFEMGSNPIMLEFHSMSAIGANSLIVMDNNLKEFYKITVVPTSSRVHIYKYNWYFAKIILYYFKNANG